MSLGMANGGALNDLRIYPGTFPVDSRHQAKIEREKLAAWAAGASSR